MLSEIVDIIKSGRTFLVTSHIRLDGDAVGSELALYESLRQMGKNVVVYNRDRTPELYRFLPDAGVIVNVLESVRGFDAVFVLDCSEIDRVGEEAGRIASIRKIINIDHHVSNDRYGHLTLTDPYASSTGEMIYRLLDGMKAEVTKDIATNLYAAILTDTGAFRYSNTSKETFLISSLLVDRGAEPSWIAQQVYETNPATKIRLLGKALGTLEFHGNGAIGIVHVSQKMLGEADALWEYTEGFVEFPRSVEGVEVAVLFSEIGEKAYKASLRSKGHINVERIARTFGGGGHHNAAACRMQGDFEKVRDVLVDAILNDESFHKRTSFANG
jgi:bifunctional oligoribonuclease and PAP phosphatase NrnA